MDQIIIRVDNDRSEIAAQLGNDFLDCITVIPIEFDDGATVEQFWKTGHTGLYFLLTKSEHQPTDEPSVHITILKNGQLRHATAALLKKPLVGVQHVILGHEPVN
jgi:hypothetical protein